MMMLEIQLMVIKWSDAGLFDIDSDSELIFLSAPDYETPGSAATNAYSVTVTATDGGSNTTMM